MTYDPLDTGPDDADADRQMTVNRTTYADTSADPTSAGEVQLNATDIKAFSGGNLVSLSDIGTTILEQVDFGPTIYSVLDDFADNKLTGRDPPSTTASEFATGTITNNFRPEYKTVSGSPSASSSALQLAAGNSTVQMVSASIGVMPRELEFTVQYGSNPTTSGVKFGIADSASTTSNYFHSGYYMQLENNGDPELVEAASNGSLTELITSNQSDDTSEHTLRLTRNGDDWELFYDGSSMGTATDASHTNAWLIFAGNDTDAAVDIKELKVVA